MSITTILNRKGANVTTVGADEPLTDAVALLTQEGIGALVVLDGERIAGILSERDIVRRLAQEGSSALERRVAELMSRDVTTCPPDAAVDDVMATMTNHRIRHLPVVDEGRLVGIVSIGDVVKHRMDELEIETESLQEYVLGRGY